MTTAMNPDTTTSEVEETHEGERSPADALHTNRAQQALPFAVVTGASSGLGLEMAKGLSARGYEVLLVARNRAALEALKQTLPNPAWVLVADLTQREAIDELFSWLSRYKRTPEVCINNAGFGAFGRSIDKSADLLADMIALNVTALTLLSQGAAQRMLASERAGYIMNVASTAAFQACPYLGVYGATKAYVLSFSESLAEELATSRVSVTAFCPGPTRTRFGLNAGLLADSPFDRASANAADVAVYGLEAMFERRPIAIEGRLNRISALLSKWLPRRTVRRLSAKLLKRMQ